MTIAGAGGALFAALGLPAPWLTGSMMAIAAAAMADLPVGLPARLRDVAFVLLGISMGSSATPESVTQMQAWPGSLALLALSVVATLFAGAVYLERVHGWDRVTARCASMPGAFAAVIVLAATSTADLPRVVLAQSIRIFILVALMPAMLTLHRWRVERGWPSSDTPPTNTALEVLATLAASGSLAVLLTFLRVPAGALLGAMIASGILHATGLVHGRFPPPLVIIGFVATGVVFYAEREDLEGAPLCDQRQPHGGGQVRCRQGAVRRMLRSRHGSLATATRRGAGSAASC